MRHRLAIEFDGSLESLFQSDPRLPTRGSLELGKIGIVVPDVDRSKLVGERDALVLDRTIASQGLDKFEQAPRRALPQVVALADDGARLASQDQGVGYIADVIEIATLLSIAEQPNLFSRQGSLDEDADEAFL